MSFEEELNKRFEEESRAIEEMEANGPEIFGHTLNDQQKLTVKTLKERDFFLNYSETGAGKTKAAISTAYYLDIKHVRNNLFPERTLRTAATYLRTRNRNTE